MKQLILLLVLMWSQFGFANSSVTVGELAKTTFDAKMGETPMQLLIKVKGGDDQKINFETSISDMKKIVLHTSTKKGRSINIEMLLTVVSVDDDTQNVLIYIPVRPEAIRIDGNLSPVCNVKNKGDFSWESEQDLAKRLRIALVDGKQQLQIQTGHKKNDEAKTEFAWVKCFDF